MAAKGLPVDDADLRGRVSEQVRIALARLKRRGVVRRVMREPDVWWELVR